MIKLSWTKENRKISHIFSIIFCKLCFSQISTIFNDFGICSYCYMQCIQINYLIFYLIYSIFYHNFHISIFLKWKFSEDIVPVCFFSVVHIRRDYCIGMINNLICPRVRGMILLFISWRCFCLKKKFPLMFPFFQLIPLTDCETFSSSLFPFVVFLCYLQSSKPFSTWAVHRI